MKNFKDKKVTNTVGNSNIGNLNAPQVYKKKIENVIENLNNL